MTKSGENVQKKCKRCFEYQPLYVSKCKNCGSEFTHKPSNLSVWQKVKRLLGI